MGIRECELHFDMKEELTMEREPKVYKEWMVELSQYFDFPEYIS